MNADLCFFVQPNLSAMTFLAFTREVADCKKSRPSKMVAGFISDALVVLLLNVALKDVRCITG